MHPYAFAIVMLPAFLLVSGLFWFRAYTGLAREKAFLALAAGIVGSTLWMVVPQIFPQFFHPAERPMDRPEEALSYLAGSIAVTFLTAFTLRLWGKWIGGKATDEENQPGIQGIRAWFSTGNVVVGVILVLSLWLGFDLPPLLTTITICTMLAAQPLLRMEIPEMEPVAVTEDLSSEREKILSMLESGRLTADESSELLQALRSPSPEPARLTTTTRSRRLMLIGAGLVALGFFMPWFVINPGKEAGRLMGQVQSAMNSSFGGELNFNTGDIIHGNSLRTPTISIAGGDIQRGLGWAALALALAAAGLPYFATTLDGATARTLRLLCLGGGGFIILYLITQNPRFIGIGLVMALAGYALEGIGFVQERRTLK